MNDKEFWEWFGIQEDKECVDGVWTFTLPSIDLNNLFLYTVPKLYKELSKAGASYKMRSVYYSLEKAIKEDGDPAQALRKAIEKVIENDTRT